ncbi:unnamed protein product, partial [Haemonchus placei]|uniref:SAC3_GANP domain-containing protein n=1 Tax=Haemonchus placei TaxID=6290 RepID=A0A158QMY8_HAEPC
IVFRIFLRKPQFCLLFRSLLALIGKHCPTEFDKYQVLEERDKLLSKLREARQLLFSLPVSNDVKLVSRRKTSIVMKKVAKFKDYVWECEYARSAADQDNPLPHELRSKELLKNTMDYLLKNVLDDVPGSDDDLATWYDFLWSRTRAIRKEITQLMLTDSTAVSLFERCARIHILCAYKLCHLGFDRFDQNMNTENLAKCLQSLRHLYEDLGKLSSCRETFNTEAEFRGYDVMLHLHDSNIMRQVLSYRKEVRESKPVRLALQLSSALQNKNYVRFFRLLRNEATFLQCCICHRYFNTVIFRNYRTFILTAIELFVGSLSHIYSFVVYGPEPFAFFSIATITDSFDDSNRYNKDPVLSAVFEKYSLQVSIKECSSFWLLNRRGIPG